MKFKKRPPPQKAIVVTRKSRSAEPDESFEQLLGDIFVGSLFWLGVFIVLVGIFNLFF